MSTGKSKGQMLSLEIPWDEKVCVPESQEHVPLGPHPGCIPLRLFILLAGRAKGVMLV